MMDKQVAIDFIQKATNMVYSDEQKALIGSDGGACVLACAGSGKTTAMTHLIARRLLDKSIRSGRRILGVTFSKTGATEMEERLETILELLDISTTVKMKTLHSFCLEFLKDIGVMRGRTVMSEGEKLNVLSDLGKKYAKGWKYEDAETIAGLITLQRGGLRNRQDFITSFDFLSAEIGSVKYIAVYDALIKYKSDNNLIDFDDMLLLAHYKLKSVPFYGENFMEKYDCVMVDEAQDMSVLQQRIVFQLLGKDAVSASEHDAHVRNTLVLIGDDDQCIYEWMGSEPQGLAKAMYAYRLPLFTLSTNYRCPENVLVAAARCISHNEHSISKSMNAYKPGGTMQYQSVRGGLSAESQYVADQLKDALDAGVPPSSLAVLARNGAHLSLVWLYLTCYGIKSRMFGGQSTGPDVLIRHICGCFKLYTSTSDAGNVLYSLLGGNRRSSDKLASLINIIDGTFHEWLEYVLSEFVPALNVKVSEDNSYAKAGETWKKAMREYYFQGYLSEADAMDKIRRLYVACCKSVYDFYLEVLDIYRVSMAWKYKSDDAKRIFIGTMDAFRHLIVSNPERTVQTLESLDKHKAPNKNYVTLSTAHSAKGREWNTVYIVCDDAYAFPSQQSIAALEKSGDNRAVKRFIEAERRLHYVAMTRAKDTLCIVGGDVAPGRFLRESIEDDTTLVIS